MNDFLNPHTEGIVAACADEFGVTTDDIMSRSRKEPTAMARQMVFYILRIYHRMTYQAIADELDRCHVAVISGIKRIGSMIEIHPEIMEHYVNIVNKLKQDQ